MRRKSYLPSILGLLLLLAACGGDGTPTGGSAGGSTPTTPGASADDGGSDDGPSGPGGMSFAELALYQGPDREALLLEGAENENRRISWYTSSNPEQGTQAVAWAFEEKYGIAVDIWRGAGGAGDLAQRVVEEYNSGRHNVDIIESTAGQMYSMRDVGVLQPFALAEPDMYPEGVSDPDGYFAAFRESYVGVGFNTNVYSEDDMPRTYQDLLDPRWEGELFITSSETGIRWVGAMEDLYGSDFVDQLIGHNVRVMNIGGRALSDLVVAGEIPMSPMIFNSHMEASIGEGAPVSWVPLEPVLTNTGTMGVAAEAPNPYTALLFIDFVFSEEGARLYVEAGYQSPRSGMDSEDFVFSYDGLERYYEYAHTDNYDTSYRHWQDLLNRFVTESR